MQRNFDSIDLFFIIMLSIYCVALFLFVSIFLIKLFEPETDTKEKINDSKKTKVIKSENKNINTTTFKDNLLTILNQIKKYLINFYNKIKSECKKIFSNKTKVKNIEDKSNNKTKLNSNSTKNKNVNKNISKQKKNNKKNNNKTNIKDNTNNTIKNTRNVKKKNNTKQRANKTKRKMTNKNYKNNISYVKNNPTKKNS